MASKKFFLCGWVFQLGCSCDFSPMAFSYFSARPAPALAAASHHHEALAAVKDVARGARSSDASNAFRLSRKIAAVERHLSVGELNHRLLGIRRFQVVPPDVLSAARGH
jgi:hypothetical protein